MFIFLKADTRSLCGKRKRKGENSGMEMESKTKRSYTVPVLLLIMTGMAVLIVFLASRLMVQQQEDMLEDGQRLAEKYEDAAMFAQKLREGADLLLSGAQTEERIRGKASIAQAFAVSGDFLDLLAEAAERENGTDREEARKPYAAAVEALNKQLDGIGGQEGTLSPQEQDVLKAVRDGAGRMDEALQGFRLPSVDAGLRSMAAGEGWIEPALKAAEAWTSLAARLQ